MGEQVAGFFRENALFLLVLAILVGGFFMLRTKGTRLASIQEFDQRIGDDRPAVVEFYSNT